MTELAWVVVWGGMLAVAGLIIERWWPENPYEDEDQHERLASLRRRR